MKNQGSFSEKRVGIDFHVANGIYQGVRTYLANLIEAMLKVENELTYFIYAKNPGELSSWGNHNSKVSLKKLPSTSGRFNLVIGFPLCAIRDKLSLFHSQYVLPPFIPCKSVLTIHDILYESHPEFFPEHHRRLLKFFVPFSARRADRIISVSEFTKRQIIQYYGIPEEKITVIYEGASDRFAPVKDRDLIFSILRRYGIGKKYVLFVGRIEPRKNIVGLLKAFAYIKKRGHSDLCLVIVGNQDRIFREKELFDKIEEMGLGSDIIFTGGVSEDDLPVLYNGAEVLVYPAFAEGFGLPVLEAMACGTPVITSNTASLPEVVGEDGMLVDPYSFEEIGKAMERILGNHNLRQELVSKGLQRATKFRWEYTAKRTIEVYKEVLARKDREKLMKKDRHRQQTREEWAQSGIDLQERIKNEQLHWDEWAQREEVEIPRFPITVKIDDDAKLNFPYPTEKWGFLSHVGRILGGLDWHGKKVLQLGGSGAQAVKFAVAGSHPVLLIDPSCETLKLAVNRAQAYGVENSISVIQAIAEEMPFPDNTFDIVFSAYVLHHTVLEKSAPEIYRVLKPGGTLCFLEPFEGNSLFKLLRIILPYPGKEKRTSAYEYPFRYKDLSVLANVFDGNDYLFFGVFMALTEYLVRLIGKQKFGYKLTKMLEDIDYLITERIRVSRRLCLRVGGKLSKKT